MLMNAQQQQAVELALRSKSLFITGGAGTGKSVVIAHLVKNDSYNRFIVCATTNQAARILSEKIGTGISVKTLHSVLGLHPTFDGSTKNSDELMTFAPNGVIESLVKKVLVIDEASMICRPVQEYIQKLISEKRLGGVIFVGDRYQLPCVKDDPFDYNAVDEIIELTQVMRSEGALESYYNQIRTELIDGEELSYFSEATYFDDREAFIEHMNNIRTSKLVVSWTNATANIYSSRLDDREFYTGQLCNALSPCSYRNIEGDDVREITTNSHIVIDKIFGSYRQMKRDAQKAGYEFYLPNEPIGITIKEIVYARVYNEDNELMYISLWDAMTLDKTILYLNHMTREYRAFQDQVRSHIGNNALWYSVAKNDGYLKSLKQLSGRVKLSKSIWDHENLYWNNFFAINQAIPVRSVLSSTAHRAQGMTVETVGIDMSELAASPDKRLQYVALTRASKQIIMYVGGSENEKNAA